MGNNRREAVINKYFCPCHNYLVSATTIQLYHHSMKIIKTTSKSGCSYHNKVIFTNTDITLDLAIGNSCHHRLKRFSSSSSQLLFL